MKLVAFSGYTCLINWITAKRYSCCSIASWCASPQQVFFPNHPTTVPWIKCWFTNNVPRYHQGLDLALEEETMTLFHFGETFHNNSMNTRNWEILAFRSQLSTTNPHDSDSLLNYCEQISHDRENFQHIVALWVVQKLLNLACCKLQDHIWVSQAPRWMMLAPFGNRRFLRLCNPARSIRGRLTHSLYFIK